MNYETIAQYSEIIGGFAFLIVSIWLFRKFVLPAIRAGEISRNSDLVNTEHRREELRDVRTDLVDVRTPRRDRRAHGLEEDHVEDDQEDDEVDELDDQRTVKREQHLLVASHFSIEATRLGTLATTKNR